MRRPPIEHAREIARASAVVLRRTDRPDGDGKLCVEDVSIGMLRVAQRKLTRHAFRCNSCSATRRTAVRQPILRRRLPSGGVNTFGELQRAIGRDDAVRQGRREGRLRRRTNRAVALRETDRKESRERESALSAHATARAAPRDRARRSPALDFGNALYVIACRVETEPPPVDLDLQVPEPRGGT
jgi:hypothetical protein